MLHAQYRGNDLAYLDARSGELVTWRDLGDQTLEWEDRFKATTPVGLYSNSPAVFVGPTSRPWPPGCASYRSISRERLT